MWVPVRLRAPFPYFGGKSRVAARVWQALGDPGQYFEPFAGSLAMLLSRPTPHRDERVNDLDGMITNVWRAIKTDPAGVAKHIDWPSNELELTARHRVLAAARASLTEQLKADPEWCDVKMAGWWVWGRNLWSGHGWCPEGGGKLIEKHQHDRTGVLAGEDPITWLNALARRLRHVEVYCGSWERLLGAHAMERQSVGVFLDPPYSQTTGRDMGCYTLDSATVAGDAHKWAIAHGKYPHMRIALCGFEGEHVMPDDWVALSWEAQGGFGRDGVGGARAKTERVWLSPACLPSK